MTPNLVELVSRIEAASGPDRELDAAIGKTVWYRTLEEVPVDYLPYTASLDAALSLVPEGHKWIVQQNDSDQPSRQAFAELRRGYITSYSKAFPAWAATPALALCAAAIRSRSLTDEER